MKNEINVLDELNKGACMGMDAIDFIIDRDGKEYNITVIDRGNETVIKASSNETVLCAFERAGIVVPARCHTGECGFCRSKLVSGKVYIPEGEDRRRIADMQFNFIHPCCCYPESDLVVRIN